MHVLDAAPLWLIGLVLAVVMIAAEEIGYRARRRAPGRAGGVEPPKSDKDEDEGVASLVAAALGLLGLLFAFTFAMAQDRHDQRRRLVMAEANAVATSYLRYQAFAEPERGRLSRLMVDYTALRSQGFDAQRDRERLRTHMAKTAVLQAQIWDAVLRGLQRQPELTEPAMESTNQMFEVTAMRLAMVDARLPVSIKAALLLFALLSAFFTGYGLSLHRRHRLPMAGLFLLFSLVFMLVLDLDRPYSGAIRISHAPMLRAAEEIAGKEAAKAIETGERPAAPPPATAAAR